MKSTDPGTYRDACLVNGPNIVRWIDTCWQKLGELKETILAGDAEELEQVFEEAMIARQRWLRVREGGDWEEESSEIPTMTSFMGQLLGVGKLGRRKKRE